MWGCRGSRYVIGFGLQFSGNLALVLCLSWVGAFGVLGFGVVFGRQGFVCGAFERLQLAIVVFWLWGLLSITSWRLFFATHDDVLRSVRNRMPKSRVEVEA